MKTKLFFLFIIFFFLAGCNQAEHGPGDNHLQPTKVSTAQTKQNIKQPHADKAKAILLKKDEVKWVRAVESKDLLIVGIELEHWNTFQSKPLSKKMKKELEKELNIKTVEVTTDHKIFIELEKLEEKLRENDLSKKKLEKRLKQINKLMKEQT